MLKDCVWDMFRFKHHLVRSKEDCEPCALMPEEVKVVMLKIIVEGREASKKRRRYTY